MTWNVVVLKRSVLLVVALTGALACATAISGAPLLVTMTEGAATIGFIAAAVLAGARAAGGHTAARWLTAGLVLWLVAYACYAFDAQPWSASPAPSDVLWLA